MAGHCLLGQIDSTWRELKLDMQSAISQSATPDSVMPSDSEGSSLYCQPEDQLNESLLQLVTEDALNKIASMEPVSDPAAVIQSDNLFLHALKYTTSLGAFSMEMPKWAAEGWVWDQS
jgi:hypothetical protein